MVLNLFMYVCMYIHTYVCTNTYVHVHVAVRILAISPNTCMCTCVSLTWLGSKMYLFSMRMASTASLNLGYLTRGQSRPGNRSPMRPRKRGTSSNTNLGRFMSRRALISTISWGMVWHTCTCTCTVCTRYINVCTCIYVCTCSTCTCQQVSLYIRTCM